mgnify:CR=1 FL=1
MMLPYSWPVVVVLGVVIYLLYRQGFMVTKRLAAILFVYRPGRKKERVRLDTCTGWVRHAGRFQKGRTYDLTLQCQLSKGSANVLLLNKKEQALLKLDGQSPCGRVKLEEDSRYYLRWEFQSATGQCELHWTETAT